MDVEKIESAATNLIRGESKPTLADERINDPLQYVDRFRYHREQSVREVVKSAIAVCEGIDALRGDSLALGRFLIGLAEAKVISKVEAEKVELSKMSMISKIRKINEHQDIILHPKIADKICTGYSVLYELGLLIDDLSEESDKSEQLGEHLATLDGALTRKWIKDMRDTIAPKQPRKKAGHLPEQEYQPNEGDDEGIEEASEIESQPRDNTTSDMGGSSPANVGLSEAVVADVGEPISAAIIVVSQEDAADLVASAELDEWQQSADQMAENSAIFVFARLNTLLNISRVIQTFGPFSCANVYMLSQPNQLEATKCNVLALYECGEGVAVDAPNWKPSDTPTHIAEQFLKGVSGRRMQFYASAPSDGWELLTINQQ